MQCTFTCFLAVWLCAAAWSAPFAAADTPSPRISLGFDDDIASGASEDGVVFDVQGQPAQVPGVDGRAVVVGGADRLTARLPGSLDPAGGTLSLWACPVNWDATTPRFQFLATVPHADVHNQDILLYKTHNQPAISCVVRNPDVGARSIQKPIISWKPGEWHHVTATWDASEIALYLDGVRAGRTPALKLPQNGWDRIVFGIPYRSWTYLGDERTAIDAVAVYDRALNAREVAALYDRDMQNSPALQRAHRERTQAMNVLREANLALDSNGGAVFASSFENYTTSYTDLLIDGDLDSAWKSWDEDVPQWVELRWEYPVRVDRVAFVDVPPSDVTAFRVLVWNRRNAWNQVAVQTAPVRNAEGWTETGFDTVLTDRLRVVFEGNNGPCTQLAELAAFGPPQPRVGALQPFWKGWHLWYPEPDEKIHMEPRAFRKTFDLPANATVRNAFVQLYTNDLYDVFVNGVKVADGFKHMAPVAVTDHLRPGPNCLAIEATPTSQPGWRNMALLAELTVNLADETRFVVTDDTWKTARDLPEGWTRPAFDDSTWATPFMVARAGKAIWGRLGYADRTANEQAAITRADVVEDRLAPAGTATVRLTVDPGEGLRYDHVLVYELGERAVITGNGDYTPVRGWVEPEQPTSEWAPHTPHTVTFTIALPEWAPQGALPLRIRGLNVQTGPGLVFEDTNGRRLDSVVDLHITRFGGAAAVPPPPQPARVRHDPSAAGAFVLGDTPTVPLVWAFHNPTFEKLHAAAATGIHLYQARAYPVRPDGTDEGVRATFEQLRQHCEAICRIDPEARILIFLDLRPSMVWLEQHPEARLLTAAGKLGPQSYFSAEHKQIILYHLRHLIPRLEAEPWAGRIFAYHIMSCGTPDSALGGAEGNVFEPDRSKLTLGDFSPQAKDAFRTWLREKYGRSETALRAAWRDPGVSFDTAAVSIEQLTAEGTDGGLFRDPAAGAAPADYFAFISGAIYRFHEDLAACVRNTAAKRRILGCYYGYDVQVLTGYNCVGAPLQNNNFYQDGMLSRKDFDYVAIVPSYSHRLAGSHFEPQHSLGSLRLHGQQYMAELDTRTFTAIVTRWGRHRSQRESIEIAKRDVGEAILNGTAAWFADWSRGGARGVGFYSDPELLDTIARAQQIYADSLQTPRESAAEIAVFVSGEAYYYQDVYRTPPLYHNLIRRMLYDELPHIGAPYDVFRIEDLANVADMPRYKLFVFINPFVFSPQVKDIVAHLRDRTLLWFYAPSYVLPGRGLSPEAMSDRVGMRIVQRPGKEIPAFHTAAPETSPILDGIEKGTAVSVKPYAYPRSNALHPIEFAPLFQVDDPEVTVLGTYADGAVAFAAKPVGERLSVYSAVPYLDRHLLRNIAVRAGVHLYCEPGPVVRANGPFLMVHKGFDNNDPLQIRLPREAALTDLFSGNPVPVRGRVATLPGKGCHTYLLKTQDAEP
jgi:hypothetical protein